MAMQIRRTATPDNPPGLLEPGQLAVEMANDPARLWVGVPTEIDETGRRLIGSSGTGEPIRMLGATIRATSQGLNNIIRTDVPGFFKHKGEIFPRTLIGSSFTITGNIVDGEPMQTLPPNKTYYVFLTERIAGRLDHALFSQDSFSHAPSTMPRNEGVEVLAAADSKVTLLIVNNNVQTGNTITDQSPRRHANITTGGANYNGGLPPMSGGHWWAAGNSGSMTLPVTDDSFDFGTGDFCIEGYVYLAAGGRTIFANIAGVFDIRTGGGGQLSVHLLGTPSSIIQTPGIFTADSWIHWAVYRRGNDFFGAVNGSVTNVGTIAGMRMNSAPAGSAFQTGGALTNAAVYVHTIRVTKGDARYGASNFTRPAVPFVLDLLGPGATDDNYSLIGMVRTVPFPGVDYGWFRNESNFCGVRSWSRRQRERLALRGTDVAATSVSIGNQGGAMAEFNPQGDGRYRISWLQWADEVFSATFFGAAGSDVGNGSGWTYFGIGIDDNINQSPDTLSFTIWAQHRMMNMAAVIRGDLSEGFHEARPLVSSAGSSWTIFSANIPAGQVANPRVEGRIG